jgi:hypothetical protein
MPIVRLTGFFKDDDGHGWSETHDKDGGSTIVSLAPFLNDFDALMQNQRRALLAGDAFYIGCRASFPVSPKLNAGDNIERDPPLRGPKTFSGNELGMTAPEAAIKMRLRNTGFTAKSDVYLRGMWSQTINFGVLDFGSVVGAEWKRRADEYAAALVAGSYGWQGTNNAATSRGNVTGFAHNTDGTVTINLTPTNAVPLPGAGVHIPVKFARINNSKSIMNRSFACKVDAGNASVTTTELVNPTPWIVGGTFIATITGFIPYSAVSYYKLAHRKTGRPFGVAPGRLPAKVLH